MSDPWNDAWLEAENAIPKDVLVFCTLELRHPTFLTDGSPTLPMAVRVVAGVADDMEFGIEAGAELNGGETVTFRAIPFYSERPEFAEGKMPECLITVDNVGRELAPLLEEAVKMRADLIAVYREYRSDDLDEPCFGPVEFSIRNVKMSGATVTGTARIDDLSNRKFPSKNYTITEFPGLLQ